MQTPNLNFYNLLFPAKNNFQQFIFLDSGNNNLVLYQFIVSLTNSLYKFTFEDLQLCGLQWTVFRDSTFLLCFKFNTYLSFLGGLPPR